MLDGVDVSRHKPPDRCDWDLAYREAGIRYCYAKSSEGADFVDPSASDHLARLARSPVIAGVFHFAQPANRRAEDSDLYAGGEVEGRHAFAVARDMGALAGHLPIALDLEWGGYKFKQPTTVEDRDSFVRGFVDTVERLAGRPPVVYVGARFWRAKHSPGLALELAERGCLLWLIGYTRAAKPKREIDGWPWAIWQWSGGGPVELAEPTPGLPRPIDRNRARMTLGELHALAGVPRSPE